MASCGPEPCATVYFVQPQADTSQFVISHLMKEKPPRSVCGASNTIAMQSFMQVIADIEGGTAGCCCCRYSLLLRSALNVSYSSPSGSAWVAVRCLFSLSPRLWLIDADCSRWFGLVWFAWAWPLPCAGLQPPPASGRIILSTAFAWPQVLSFHAID